MMQHAATVAIPIANRGCHNVGIHVNQRFHPCTLARGPSVAPRIFRCQVRRLLHRLEPAHFAHERAYARDQAFAGRAGLSVRRKRSQFPGGSCPSRKSLSRSSVSVQFQSMILLRLTPDASL